MTVEDDSLERQIENLLKDRAGQLDDPTVREKFFYPLMEIVEGCHQKLGCPELRDDDYLQMGCERVLATCMSGRDFLQGRDDNTDQQLRRTTFFDSLNSSRRGLLVEEASTKLFFKAAKAIAQEGRDQLEMIPELKGRPVFAADGHQIEHACHALRDTKGRLVGAKSLYVLCLHTGLFHDLASVQGNGQYGQEIPAFRKQLPGFLRHLGCKPHKSAPPIFTVDPAYIDNPFWDQLRILHSRGARFVTTLKQDMKPVAYEELTFDQEAAINRGITGFAKVVFDSGITMRLINYCDPETERSYQFLTTVDDISPGAIAYLYRLRWRIEKSFDTTKVQLGETKQWTTSNWGQKIQAHFIALTVNLLTIFRNFLEIAHGIYEEKLEAKHRSQIEERETEARARGCEVHPFVRRSTVIVKLSAQFIRCLRNLILIRPCPLKDALELLFWRMYVYL